MAASVCTRGRVALISSPHWAQLVQLFTPISYRYSGIKSTCDQFKFTPMLTQLSGSSLERENHAVLTVLPALVLEDQAP